MVEVSVRTRIKMEGGKKFTDYLKRGSDQGKMAQAIGEGMVKGGVHIIKRVKDTAPVDTGHLRASYGIFTPDLIRKRYSEEEAHPRDYNNPVQEVVVRPGGTSYFRFGTRVPYAVLQEHWTTGHREGRSPYQRPAIIEKRRSVVLEIRRAIIGWINKGKHPGSSKPGAYENLV